MTSPFTSQKNSWSLVLIFFLLSLGIGTAGYIYYENIKKQIIKEKRNELLAIAELKVESIKKWREDRMGEAAMIRENPFTAHHIKLLMENPAAPSPRQDILNWMKSMQEHYQCESVILLDGQGNPKLYYPSENDVLGVTVKALAAETITSRKVIFSDLYLSSITNAPRLSLLVPIQDQKESGADLIGVLLLRVDPYRFLYPLIQSWPTPSHTAESVLVRQEGNEVLFLNELRHQENTGLSLRMALSNEDLPAVMAFRGKESIVEGIDYRGVPVLAAMLHVPDTPWFLVAKVDLEEIYQPIREQARSTAYSVSGLIFLAGISVFFVWRQQQTWFNLKQYEKELEHQALSQHYAYLTMYSHDIILLINRDMKIVEANDRAVSAYGYTYSELLQLGPKDLRPLVEVLNLEAIIKQWEVTGGLVYESVHKQKDGTTFPVEISIRAIEAEGNKFYQAVIRDITERKRMEGELRSREEYFRSLIENASDLITILNEEGTILYESPSVKRVLNYEPEELIAKEVYDFIHPEDRPAAIGLLGKIIESPHLIISKEIRFRHKNGSWTILEVMVRNLLNNPAVAGVVVNSRDISGRKRTEEALRRERDLIDRIVETSPAGIFMVNREGEIVFANTRAVQVLALNNGKTGRKPYVSFCLRSTDIEGNPVPDESLPFRQVVTTGQPVYDVQHAIEGPNGQRMYLSINGAPMFDELGGLDGVVLSLNDITGQKNAEAEIKNLNEALVIRVFERTAQLEAVNKVLGNEVSVRKRAEEDIQKLNAGLEHRAAELAAANRELEAFSYSVSHDLRAPLRSIDGFSQALLEDYHEQLDGQGKDYLRRVRSASQRMGRLIDDLLNLSRVTRSEMRREEVELSAMARVIAQELQETQPERQVEFFIEPGLTAQGDTWLLRVVLENLFGNAWKFTSGHPFAKIEFGITFRDGKSVYYVRDDGAGFDMTYSDKLFGAFQRLHGASEFEGTGIGLATVARIIFRHGGRVWAEGAVERGATFYFTF